MNPTRVSRRNASAGGNFRNTLKEKGYRFVMIIAFLLGRFFGESRLVPRSLSLLKGARSKTAFAEKITPKRLTDYEKRSLIFLPFYGKTYSDRFIKMQNLLGNNFRLSPNFRNDLYLKKIKFSNKKGVRTKSYRLTES